MEKLKIGWFSTGRDKAARDLPATAVKNIKRGELSAEISFVFCNQQPSESSESDLFLKSVRSYRIPLICFSSETFKFPGERRFSYKRRLEYDREVMQRLSNYHPDLCVLAGYMLIVGPEMCQRYTMINLHPAAPGGPTGTWQEVIWQLIDETKAETTGVMMHLVTPELDKGPPVTYCTFPIKDESNKVLWEGVERGNGNARRILFWDIRRRGLKREFPLIIATLKAFTQGKVRVELEKERIVDDKGEVIKGYDLTEEIDAAIKGEI